MSGDRDYEAYRLFCKGVSDVEIRGKLRYRSVATVHNAVLRIHTNLAARQKTYRADYSGQLEIAMAAAGVDSAVDEKLAAEIEEARVLASRLDECFNHPDVEVQMRGQQYYGGAFDEVKARLGLSGDSGMLEVPESERVSSLDAFLAAEDALAGE